MRLASSEGDAMNFLPDTVKTLDETTTGRRKKVIPLLVRLLTGTSTRDTSSVQISMSLLHGSAREMLRTLKSIYGPLVNLPSRRITETVRDNLRIEFMTEWELQNLPHGMRVSLVKAVQWVAEKTYRLNRLDNVHVDIWGDGMKRGEHQIVRLCFRIIGSPDAAPNQFNSQSRLETFTFAVFCGKDSSVNMERNLGSFSIAGEKGWLFDEMKMLAEQFKVHLTLSGDVPWISRLCQRGGTDDQALSTAPIWLPDPEPKVLDDLLKANNTTRTDIITKRIPPKIQRELCRIGCVLPHQAFYGERGDQRNGYRTKIDVPVTNTTINEFSMAYVPNASHICPDGFHQTVRNVEKDVKLAAEYLLEKHRLENLKQLESNINDRDVKHPKFSFPFKDRQTVQNAKRIGELKLSGEDAKVILANESELEGSGAGALFENVFYYDRACPRPLNPLSFEVVMGLQPDLPTITPDDCTTPTLSERTLIELMFKSHNEIVKFYRNPKKSKDNVEELEKWVELYFQANMMLFPVDSAFTGYKAKLFVLPKLLREGNINSLFDHLTEATENSNHGLNHLYHNHTMRDGGREGNMSSEFEDLFHSFAKAVGLASSRNSTGVTSILDNTLSPIGPNVARNKYLQICRTPLPTLQLNLGKKQHLFMSMRFYFILPTGSSFKVGVNFVDPVTQKSISGANASKISLSNVVTHLQGTVVSDSMFDNLSEYGDLQHCYIVLNDGEFFKQYRSRMGEIKKPGWTPAASTLPPRFLQAARSQFQFVKATYILDCFQAGELLSPTLPCYSFDHDRNEFASCPTSTHMTRHMERQRQNTPTPGRILAKTALKRSRRSVQEKPISRVSMRRKTTKSLPAHVSRMAYILFYRHYANTQSSIYKDSTGKVPVDTISSRASNYWKNACRGEEREKWFHEASVFLRSRQPNN